MLPLRKTLAAFTIAVALFLNTAAAQNQQTLLIVGDSLSAGYGLQPGQGWADLLAREYAAQNIRVINDSISGDTTAGGAARLPAALERLRPQWVIIELGGNDGLRGASLEAMEDNLTEMVQQTRAAAAQPILFGMKLPPNYGARYTAEFEQVFARVAAATDTPHLPFFLHGIGGNPDYFQDDAIHPNAQAQPLIVENVRAFLAECCGIDDDMESASSQN